MIYNGETLEQFLMYGDPNTESNLDIKLKGINLETFTLSLGSSTNTLDLRDLSKLKRAINEKFNVVGSLMGELLSYHKDSDEYWLKDLETKEWEGDEDEDYPFYGSISFNNILINHYKNTGDVVSDMGVIYEKMISDFFAEDDADRNLFDFVLNREDMSVYAKTPEAIMSLYKWADLKIIQPYVDYIVDLVNIKDFKVEDGKMLFTYN